MEGAAGPATDEFPPRGLFYAGISSVNNFTSTVRQHCHLHPLSAVVATVGHLGQAILYLTPQPPHCFVHFHYTLYPCDVILNDFIISSVRYSTPQTLIFYFGAFFSILLGRRTRCECASAGQRSGKCWRGSNWPEVGL